MLYTMGEIIWLLVIAAILGFILGWLIRGIRLRDELEGQWSGECKRHRERAQQLQGQLDDCLGGKSSSASVDDSGSGMSKAEAEGKLRKIAQRTAGKEPVDDDNLKKIHGVGPVFEKLLKSMGITSFKQIANFKAEDIGVVAAALGGFSDRIERDDWTSGATKAYREKYGKKI